MPLSTDPEILRVPAFMRKKGRILNVTKRSSPTLHKNSIKYSSAIKKPKKQLPVARTAKVRAKKTEKMGVVTHYYEKIQVGVIKLFDLLEVGDTIVYKTEDGPCAQVVTSLQINREPVFKAQRGAEVGLKLEKIPLLGSPVIKSAV